MSLRRPAYYRLSWFDGREPKSHMGYDKTLGGMSSYRASVTFRVIEAGTGEVIATASQGH